MWEHRNGILHDKQQGRLARRTRQTLIQLHREGPRGTDSSCKPFFRKPIRVHLESPLATQMTWVTRIQNAREFSADSTAAAQRHLARQRALMHRWLDTTT